MKTYKGESFKFAHIKRDGIQIQIQKGRATTRNDTDFTDRVRWHSTMTNAFKCCPSVRLFCEAWVVGKPSSDVITAMNEQWSSLRIDVFGVDVLEGQHLEEMARFCESNRLRMIPYLISQSEDDAAKWPVLPGCAGTFIDIEHTHLDEDDEGFIMCDHVLDGNARKYKPTTTIDLVVTGTRDGRGRNLGLIGSLKCSVVEGHEVANVGGLSDSDRCIDEDDWIGKIVEVEYQYVGARGRLRHPRLVRVREDKPKAECTLSQDNDLTLYWSNK